MTRVLVLGGTSEIATAIVRRIAEREPCEAVLAGRDETTLRRTAGELTDAGVARALTVRMDAGATETHAASVGEGFELLDGADLVILAVGVLTERGDPLRDIPAGVRALQDGATGAGSLLLHSARLLREAGGGTIMVLSSVAAVRPRASNPVYGAEKAALDALAEGLADALVGTTVRILVVRPGFVRTRMTRKLAAPFYATDAGTVANAAVRGLERDAQTVWAPAYLRWVMLFLRLLPRAVFRRLPL